MRAKQNLFKNKTFFLNRETPIHSLQWMILAFGGQIETDVDSLRVTHHIMDRPLKTPIATREYVVPQWIYDCINNSILLPVASYKPGEPAPAHLSPFVDNREEGYIPTRQHEINELKGVTEEVYLPSEEEDESEEEAP